MTLVKTLKFDDDVLTILTNTFDVEQVNGHFVGKLTCGQLNRKMYEKVNKALEVMGGKWNRGKGGHIFQYDPREQLTGLLDNGKLEVVKEGWFPTPAEIAELMYLEVGYDGGWILEPSAGEGAIADVVAKFIGGKDQIHCVEKNPNRAQALRDKGYDVTEGDFLNVFSSGFARVFMNPPFEDNQDIDHVRHAYDLLNPGGALVAIMSEGPFFRQDNKAKEFRAWLEGCHYWVEPLPADSFKESGTGVNTQLVVVWKE
jgi:hypothetical protein